MIYLASPYTHHSKTTMQERYSQVLEAAATLTKSGLFIYSPIVHFHEMAVVHEMPRDYKFWERNNLHMLTLASSLWVLKLSGWDLSVGVAAECEYAARVRKPIQYLTLEEVRCG